MDASGPDDRRLLLRCSSCGAPASVSARTTCAFCGSPVTAPAEVTAFLETISRARFDRRIQLRIADEDLLRADTRWPVARRVWALLLLVFGVLFLMAWYGGYAAVDAGIAAAFGLVPALVVTAVVDRRLFARARRACSAVVAEIDRSPLFDASRSRCPNCGCSVSGSPTSGATVRCGACGVESVPEGPAAVSARTAARARARKAELARLGAEYVEQDLAGSARALAAVIIIGAMIPPQLWTWHARAAAEERNELAAEARRQENLKRVVEAPELNRGLDLLAEAIEANAPDADIERLWHEVVCHDEFHGRLAGAPLRAMVVDAITRTRTAPWHPNQFMGLERTSQGRTLTAHQDYDGYCLNLVETPAGDVR